MAPSLADLGGFRSLRIDSWKSLSLFFLLIYFGPNVECLKKKEFSYRHLAQLRMLKFLMQCCHIPFNQLKQVDEIIMETAAEPMVDGSAVPDDELKLVVTASHFPPDFHQCLSRRAVWGRRAAEVTG
ncbi:unnamed protein product [Linum tenue]|uniref:Uncharacterized protein n=2 Tax=Linum tenue TaxID=586396 RepID=A0AAV0P5P9_9ROSI|nr:unnamed protein product [Linum tenue]